MTNRSETKHYDSTFRLKRFDPLRPTETSAPIEGLVPFPGTPETSASPDLHPEIKRTIFVPRKEPNETSRMIFSRKNHQNG
jgi:hypothetical protein